MSDDLTTRARAEQILGGLEGLLTGPLPQDKERKARNIEHVLNCLAAYGRDERRRVWEGIEELDKRCVSNTKFRISIKHALMVIRGSLAYGHANSTSDKRMA